jgi:RNA polymerase sigma-54 factor
LPNGTVAPKDFFSSRIDVQNGVSVSSNVVRRLIKERIAQEDKKRPWSDQALCNILSKEHNFKISRRTVAKYREELKILSTAFRREK